MEFPSWMSTALIVVLIIIGLVWIYKRGQSAAPLLAFTVGNEDIFAATDKIHALALANAITKPVPAYSIEDVEPVEAKYLAQPWGDSKETLQQRLDARTEPGYFAGWQD